MAATEQRTVQLDKLRIDGDTQPRAAIDNQAVLDYAADKEAGAHFPEIETVFDGKHYWIWDGFHRYLAEHKRGRDRITVNVQAGTIEDARWLSVSANQTHGMRRTQADRRLAVEKALAMKPDLTDRAIGEHVGVDHKTVASVRSELLAKSPTPEPETRTGKDGRTYRARKPKKAGGGTEPVREFPELAPDKTSIYYPHSDLVRSFLASTQTFLDNVDMKGGIQALLGDRHYWRRSETQTLRQLQAQIKELTSIYRAILKAIPPRKKEKS